MADQGVLTEHQKELGKKAKLFFQNKDYEGALKVLDQLQKLRDGDSSVSLNLAVTKYHQSGMTKTDELRKAMSNIANAMSVSLDQAESAVETDNCTLFYNQAVILYHTRQYLAALSLAESLLHVVDLTEDPISKMLIFLLASLYLETQQEEQALRVLSQLDKLPESDTKYRACLYKLRASVQQCSLRLCKKETKVLQSCQVNATSPLLLYLRVRLDVARGHPTKALRLMQEEVKRLASTGLEFPANVRHNTMGCIYFLLRKFHLAANSFKNALNEDQKMSRQTFGSNKPAATLSGAPLPRLGASRQHEILYNLGIQLLQCARPLPAFDCLVQSVRVYTGNPRLWLRLAECCVLVHKESNDSDRSIAERQKVIRSHVGSGVHRKLLLGSGLEDPRTQTRTKESAAMPMPTLEFAALCLKNALNLLPNPNISGEESEPELVPARPAPPMRREEVQNLRCSVLAQSAYVSLCLHDYLRAHEFAHALLQQPRLSPAHRYLGLMYRAEASVWMDRIADATQDLNPENVTDISTVPPEPPQDEAEEVWEGRRPISPPLAAPGTAPVPPGPQWSPRDLNQARSLMAQNLASAYAIRGELDKAHRTVVKSLQIVPNQNNLTVQAFLLKIYLDLMEGRRKTAFNILKDHFGHAVSKHSA